MQMQIANSEGLKKCLPFKVKRNFPAIQMNTGSQRLLIPNDQLSNMASEQHEIIADNGKRRLPLKRPLNKTSSSAPAKINKIICNGCRLKPKNVIPNTR
jgi:hypothetical protein